jgi:hypothetical protein
MLSPALTYKSFVMQSLMRSSFAFLIALLLTGNSYAQQKTVKEAAKELAIKTAIENQNYTFKADYALPFRGGQRYLTSDYDLRVVKDSVIAFLPYFGQVFMNPPINPEDAGINFTSTKFDYTSKVKKKGGWSIVITPKNEKYITKLILDIYTNGATTVYVNSNYRDPITFTGYLKFKE